MEEVGGEEGAGRSWAESWAASFCPTPAPQNSASSFPSNSVTLGTHRVYHIPPGLPCSLLSQGSQAPTSSLP